MRLLLIAIISLFFSLQNSFALNGDKFYFDCSASVYRGSEGKDIVEVYYAVYQKFLSYTNTSGSSFTADAKLEISIFPKGSDKPIAENTYKIPSEIQDTSGENSRNKIMGQINYEIKYGEYRLKIVASDFNNPNMRDSTEIDLVAEDFSGPPKMSDIELSTSITKSTDTKSLFYKNTLEVTPNAGGLYGKNINELHYYVEIYNLNQSNISDEFIIRRRILTANNEELIVSDKKIKRNVESRVEYGMFKIDTLSTAGYVFEVSLLDPQKNINIVKTKKFFLYTSNDDKPSSNKGQEDYLKSEYVILNEKDLDDLFDKAIYIRKDEDIKNYKDLKTVEQKRKFMYDFWKKLDDMPMTPQNEFKIAYFKRMNEANKKFKEAFRDGWKTDRGRIYILYGPPSDIQHNSFESETKSYDIWVYDALQGGTNAVFVEKEAGTGIYTLVSSTIRGEFRDDNWQTQLKQFK